MGSKYTDAQKRASSKYEAEHIKKMTFKFNLEHDRDILERLEQVDNKNGYIKELIRKDIRGV